MRASARVRMVIPSRWIPVGEIEAAAQGVHGGPEVTRPCERVRDPHPPDVARSRRMNAVALPRGLTGGVRSATVKNTRGVFSCGVRSQNLVVRRQGVGEIADRHAQQFEFRLDFADRRRADRGFDGTRHDVLSDRKSTRLNSSHSQISYAVFCLKKKKFKNNVIS